MGKAVLWIRKVHKDCLGRIKTRCGKWDLWYVVGAVIYSTGLRN